MLDFADLDVIEITIVNNEEGPHVNAPAVAADDLYAAAYRTVLTGEVGRLDF